MDVTEVATRMATSIMVTTLMVATLAAITLGLRSFQHTQGKAFKIPHFEKT
jgi:hypothetical protein